MQAEARAIEYESRDQQQSDKDQKRDRRAIHVALAEKKEIVVLNQTALQILDIGAVERQPDAADHIKRSQRDDESGDAQSRDQQPVYQPGDHADRDRDWNGERRVHVAEADHVVDRDAANQQHRADGEIDAAADQHKGLADGDDAEDREIGERFGQIVERAEARRRGPEQRDQRDQREHQALACAPARARGETAPANTARARRV